VSETVLVTGAAGFIGAPLVRSLLEGGYRVVAVEDFSVGSRERMAGLDVSVVEADVRDTDALARAVASASPWGVVHLAALHFIPDCIARPDETVARNVLGTQSLLDALAAAPPERLLFASTGDVYAPSSEPRRESDPTEPINVYGRSKLDAERLIELFAARHPGSAARSARLFNVYGPGETNPHVVPEILRQLREGDTLRLGNVDASRDWVFLDDAVAALVGLLENGGGSGPVNVASGEATSVRELVELFARLTDRPLRIETDPERLRPVDRPLLLADPSLLRALLPSQRPTPLEQGLERLLATEGLRRTRR
jgi:UDP-glucose 4-epimerase